MFGAFLFMTYYLQIVKGYSPIRTGVAFFPMVLTVMVSAGAISARLLPRVPPRALIVPGMLVSACGMLWMLTLEPGTGYAGGVLVTGVLYGFGAGMIMPVAMNYATRGVDQGDSGVASATVNAAQQVGSSIGIALLNTIATSATADYLVSHGRSPAVAKQALVEGFGTGSAWGAGILLAGALIVAVLMNAPRPETRPAPGAETEVPLPAHS